MNIRQQVLTSVCAALLVLLSACGSSPTANLYLIEPVVTRAPGTSATPVTVQVDKVVLPEHLERKEILSRNKAYEVSAASFDRWAEPLESNITSTLAENLSALIKSDSVIAYPWRLPEPADYRVSVQVLEFGPKQGGNVELRALWQVVDAEGQLVVLRRSQYSASGRANDPADLVGAMSRTLGELSHDIAATIGDGS